MQQPPPDGHPPAPFSPNETRYTRGYDAGYRQGYTEGEEAGLRRADAYEAGYRAAVEISAHAPETVSPRCPACIVANPGWPSTSARRNAYCPAHGEERRRWRQNESNAGRKGTDRQPFSPTPLPRPKPDSASIQQLSILLYLAGGRDDPLARAVRDIVPGITDAH